METERERKIRLKALSRKVAKLEQERIRKDPAYLERMRDLNHRSVVDDPRYDLGRIKPVFSDE